MPVTTYLEIIQQQPLSSPRLEELLAEIKSVTGKNWVIQERSIKKTGWFRKDSISVYQVLVFLHGAEYQIINFHDPKKGSSISFWNSEEAIAAYITGYLAGLARQVQNAQ
jgi:hypothetical protein